MLRRSNRPAGHTRAPAANQSGSNAVFGADANLAFFRIFRSTATTPAQRRRGQGDQSSYRGRFVTRCDRYGLQLGTCWSVTRSIRTSGSCAARFPPQHHRARFSPRPKSNGLIRRLDWEVRLRLIPTADDTSRKSQLSGTFQIDFDSSDQWTLDNTHDLSIAAQFPESLRRSPADRRYDYDTVRMTYELGQQRRVSGRLSVATARFTTGTRRKRTSQRPGRAFPHVVSIVTGHDDELDRSAAGHL